ncbi:MAG: ATP-grasp domain-containing protein [Melioribacteraceae bacterium]|nr:MAG: ATP-grasp domain-containing protein [Melioribacteraceae bacterium]
MLALKKLGANVILLTSQSLESANWPREYLDDIYYMPDVNKEWNMNDVINAVSYLARSVKIDRIVALDDFDVEKAAKLREHLRVPGMGDTTARYFRDKLAMRMRAKEVGINAPEFVHILNYDEIKIFIRLFDPPYVLKPRMQAGAIGIKKITSPSELWNAIENLGDDQSFYLLEQFIPGDIYHVDSIIYNNEIKFAITSKYGHPPMEVAHEGRVFTSRTIQKETNEDKALKLMNIQVLNAMGLLRGVSHTEFIKAKSDGKFYFLETSARVGGANLHELVKAASGINLWEEWAKIELLGGKGDYELPSIENNHAAILLSLAKQEWPDMNAFHDEEVVWRLNKKNHVGVIVKSENYDRITELINEYVKKFYDEFFASYPAPEKPTD